ncbi:signal peptide peptidase-like 2B isoform X4 [Peromyscus californicus insignis]|uniref:signal peptide peptidase-like 2B isoform X4 n=1 Tax=Peromyscus californicus insignis TaxID=564181 RepID=UPI0022A74155|nr:signal peptide peptidase-like 2B isoform X4 [Peromyscus californicus insignis]
MAAARLAAALLLLAAQVACEFGVLRVVSQSGGTRGRDYCILYNPQWAHLPHDLSKVSLLKLRDLSSTQLCSYRDLPVDLTNQVALVARGNCTFYEKVRLAQGSGARALLVVSKERLVPPGGNKTQYEEISIPVALLSHRDLQDIFKRFGHAVMVALYAPSEPVMDYNMVIIFVMAVGTVALGGYWAGSRDVKKRYMKHKRDDGPEKEDEAVDVTPVMICVFVVMCCFMLVLLYYFYDHLVYVIIGIFCLASSTGLYSCLAPCVRKLPFCTCRVPDNSLPYFHKRPQVRTLLLALFCIAVTVVWGIFRNEDQWAWVLQDILGIAFCLYMLKTIRLPTFKACTLLLLVLFVYDVFFVFITPFLTKSGNSIMVEVATGPSNSSTHEKLPMVLKVPRLNTSPLSLCDRPFSLLGFGDILVPGPCGSPCHTGLHGHATVVVTLHPPRAAGGLLPQVRHPGAVFQDLLCGLHHCLRPGSAGDIRGSCPHAAWPARAALPGPLHTDDQLHRGTVAPGTGCLLDGQRLCERCTSVFMGSNREACSYEGLRCSPPPAAAK